MGPKQVECEKLRRSQCDVAPGYPEFVARIERALSADIGPIDLVLPCSDGEGYERSANRGHGDGVAYRGANLKVHLVEGGNDGLGHRRNGDRRVPRTLTHAAEHHDCL